jgi:AraC-like DNA-binding protein
MSIQSHSIATASMTIFHLTDINTLVLNKNGSINLSYERNPIPDFLVDIHQKDLAILQLRTKQQVTQCGMYTNELGLSYLAYSFTIEQDTTMCLIIGPFLKQTPDINRLSATYKLDQKKQMSLGEFFQALKLVSPSRVQSISNLIKLMGSIDQVPIQNLEVSQKHEEKSHLSKFVQKQDETNIELIELRYKLEKELMRAVEKGDSQKAKEFFLKTGNLFDFADRFPNQPVRAMKNILIVLNTTFRISAEKGKVHPFFLHHISEKFSIKIEQINSIDHLNKLIIQMCEEYCELVKQRSITKYTLLVQKAIHFLTIHYSQPFDVNEISQYCLVHPSHLSRQFKKETGMTLTNFLNQVRIEEAKILLKQHRTSIDWIAGAVGYDDAGYFARIFKKATGMTPTKYRDVH